MYFKKWVKMNEVFIIGKVVKKEEFKFILRKGKNKSKIKIEIKLIDDSIVTGVAYDNIADFIFRKRLDKVFVYGRLEGSQPEDMKIRITKIKNI